MRKLNKKRAALICALILSALSVLPVFAFDIDELMDTPGYVLTELEDTTICFDENGDQITDWVRIEDDVYYFDEAGDMKKGWFKFEGKWYYFDDETGKLLKDQWFNNYWINEKGEVDMKKSRLY